MTSVNQSILFTPLKVGKYELAHRIVLAPLTRSRGKVSPEGNDNNIFVPYELNAEYYSQRTTPGGLLITEATPIERNACGYPGVPGIYNSKQIEGWKKVTNSVHDKKGIIFMQLWHIGRVAHSVTNNGEQPVGPSAVIVEGPSFDGVPYETPRALKIDEIKNLVQVYAQAAKNAIEAGLDGVEIHAANGYLLDQFLNDNINKRTDEYGSTSLENKSRFVLEVIDAISEAIGANRVGIRFSPYSYFQGTADSNRNATWTYLTKQIALRAKDPKNALAYVHMIEPRFDFLLDGDAKIDSLVKESSNDDPSSFNLEQFKQIIAPFGVKFITSGGYTPKSAAEKVASNTSDLVAFGRDFISNPDLVYRIKNSLPLTPYDRSTFYAADPPSKGYTSYPTYAQEQKEKTSL